MKRRRTPKMNKYEKQIDALTHRLCTCRMEDFTKVQTELFKVRDEYTLYLVQLDAKYAKKVA